MVLLVTLAQLCLMLVHRLLPLFSIHLLRRPRIDQRPGQLRGRRAATETCYLSVLGAGLRGFLLARVVLFPAYRTAIGHGSTIAAPSTATMLKTVRRVDAA
ncbi:hypothetical protein ABH933_008936 [Nocardia sp. GP40]|uniref:hypothetical protein n=1 Tax=Nocardia sp. GP40 TaxID=3156268 RepID=UPI003D1D8982